MMIAGNFSLLFSGPSHHNAGVGDSSEGARESGTAVS